MPCRVFRRLWLAARPCSTGRVRAAPLYNGLTFEPAPATLSAAVADAPPGSVVVSLSTHCHACVLSILGTDHKQLVLGDSGGIGRNDS